MGLPIYPIDPQLHSSILGRPFGTVFAWTVKWSRINVMMMLILMHCPDSHHTYPHHTATTTTNNNNTMFTTTTTATTMMLTLTRNLQACQQLRHRCCHRHNGSVGPTTIHQAVPRRLYKPCNRPLPRAFVSKRKNKNQQSRTQPCYHDKNPCPRRT